MRIAFYARILCCGYSRQERRRIYITITRLARP